MKTTIVWDHRNRAGRNEGPLEVRLWHENKAFYINTGIKVRKGEWRGDTIVNRQDAPELNERLRIVANKIDKELNIYISEGRTIDVAAIRQSVYAVSIQEQSMTVADWIEEQIPMLGLADGTKKHYYTLVRRLREFGKITSWRSLSVETLYEWDYWLHQREKPRTLNAELSGGRAEKISDAGVYKYHKCLKAIISRAERMGKVSGNPYAKVRGEFKRGDNANIEYLTEDEMHAIESLRPLAGSIMAAVRDLFVFQMYTGMAYSDSQRFDISNYQLIDGKWVVVSERIKTGVPYVNQLLPPVVEVLERYGWNTPKIDNADYNHNLKSLGMAAGIVKSLHSHMARHTFATWALSHNVPIEIVSKMLGHTNITQTQRYAKVLPKAVKSEFDRLEEIMKK